MNDPTPTASSIEATFGCSAANGNLFALRPDIPINEALEHASMMLSTAMALSAKMGDADLQTCRALGCAAITPNDVQMKLTKTLHHSTPTRKPFLAMISAWVCPWHGCGTRLTLIWS
jgi:hypothetical protein